MALDKLDVELTVVLGEARLPMHRFLRLGRGAIVALDARDDDVVTILANGLRVAQGRIVVQDGRISVEVTELVRRVDITRESGTTVGSQLLRLPSARAAAAA